MGLLVVKGYSIILIEDPVRHRDEQVEEIRRAAKELVESYPMLLPGDDMARGARSS
jgi:hypothetical protein